MLFSHDKAQLGIRVGFYAGDGISGNVLGEAFREGTGALHLQVAQPSLERGACMDKVEVVREHPKPRAVRWGRSAMMNMDLSVLQDDLEIQILKHTRDMLSWCLGIQRRVER